MRTRRTVSAARPWNSPDPKSSTTRSPGRTAPLRTARVDRTRHEGVGIVVAVQQMGVAPQLIVSWRTVRSLVLKPRICACGRKRAIERTVKPLRDRQMIAVGVRRRGRAMRGRGHGIGDRALRVVGREQVQLLQASGPTVVVELVVGALRDARHGRHRVHRVDTDRRLGREHHRARTVEHRVGDVGRLGARGDGRVDHRLEHLRGGDDGPSTGDALADDLLLEVRQLLDRELRAEIAACHHHRARGFDDAFEVLDRGAGLDLRHHERAAGVRLGAEATDVVCRAHERQRHHVDAGFDEGVEQPQVFRCGCREAEPVGRDVDAGAAL